MAKKGRKVRDNKIKKAERKALEATKPPDQTEAIEPVHELRSFPVLHIPFHPTNPDADHYGHYYSDQLYKNATLSTFRSQQWDSDCVFASTFVLADIIPGTMSEEVGWVNKERLCLRETSPRTAQSVELWLLPKRGWNFLQWVADNDVWFEQEMLALLGDGPPLVLKGWLVLDDRGGASFVHHQRCWLELAHHLSLLLGQSE